MLNLFSLFKFINWLNRANFKVYNNALKEELDEKVVVAKFANTTKHGAIESKTQTHDVDYYNLDMIISVVLIN